MFSFCKFISFIMVSHNRWNLRRKGPSTFALEAEQSNKYIVAFKYGANKYIVAFKYGANWADHKIMYKLFSDKTFLKRTIESLLETVISIHGMFFSTSIKASPFFPT